MKNFLAGLLLGVLATYWFLTQGEAMRTALTIWWSRALAPPGVEQRR